MKYRKKVWLALGLIVAVGLGGTWAWREHVIARRVQAALLARPDLTGKPAILSELLEQAETKTKSSKTRLDGIVELGRLYHANGFTKEAEACWQLLRTEQPGEARWSYYLADLRRAQSDYSGMTELLNETLSLASDYAPARLQLANLQFKFGNLDEAEDNYRLRLDALPQDPYARLGLVRVALQSKRTDEARTLLEELIKDAPDFSTAHNLYAELLAASGDATGASSHRWLGRETLRYREPEDAWLDELLPSCYDYDRLCVLGTIELQTEQFDRAIALFERAIAVDSGRSDAYELLGSVYLKRNDAGAARDLIERALPRLKGKKSAGVFTSLALAYRTLKQPVEAIRVARVGLEQVGGSQPELLNALGLALADSGKHDEAVEAWHDALAKNPGDANTNYNLARSYLALRRLDDALEALDRSLTLQPSFLPTLLLRGEIELQAGNLEAAANYLAPAFESHPEEPQARRLLATWHLRSGIAAESSQDPAAAERNYQDGLSLEKNQPDLLVRLGRFYVVNARYAEAIGPLESFHQQQPDDAPGCLFLGQAYAATSQRERAREILTKGVELAERSGNTSVAQHCRATLQQL